MALTKYVVTERAMSLINDTNVACPSYDTYSARFERLGDGLLLRLLLKILDALNYIGLYKISSHLGTDVVVTATALN